MRRDKAEWGPVREERSKMADDAQGRRHKDGRKEDSLCRNLAFISSKALAETPYATI